MASRETTCIWCGGRGRLRATRSGSLLARFALDLLVVVLSAAALIGILTLFGGTRVALPAICLAIILWVLLDLGALPAVVTAFIFRRTTEICPHCGGAGRRPGTPDPDA